MVLGSGLTVELTRQGGGVWQGTGRLATQQAFTCFGQPRASTFQITLRVESAADVGGTWSVTALGFSEVDTAPEASSQCPAASKTWSGSARRT